VSQVQVGATAERKPRDRNRSYFQQALDLRLSLHWNLEDYRFAREGGHIVYIMDANVVVFFLDPGRETQHVAAFDSERSLDRETGTAVIAAEFLFSRRLAGQHDHPAFIAPSHAEELGQVYDRLLRRGATHKPLDVASHEALSDLIDKIRHEQMSLETAARKLGHIVPEVVASLMESGLFEANQFSRLYNEDSLRPLAVHPDVTEDILAISVAAPKRVKEWTDRLLAARQFQPGRRSAAEQKARRDAEALVQALMLDEAAAGTAPKTRYVMVTADRAVFDAYAAWFWSATEERPADARFILRTPLQYAPILNVAEMPNRIDTSDIIQQTQAALDTLLAPLRGVDPHRYPQSLPMVRVLAKLAADNEKFREAINALYGIDPFSFEEGGEKRFRVMRQEWQNGFDAAIAMNTELLSRRLQADILALETLYQEKVDLPHAIHSFQQEILGHLEAAHLVENLHVSIRRLMAGADYEIYASPSRGPLTVRMAIPSVIGEQTLEETLNAIASGDRALISRVDATLKSAPRYQATYFAACVAYRCNRWNTALQHARRAIDLLPEPSGGSNLEFEHHEISSLAAAAARFALPSAEAVRMAFNWLDGAIEYATATSDHFGVARALAERMALVLTLLFRSQFLAGSISSLTDVDIEPELRSFQAHFDRGLAALTSCRELSVHCPARPLATVEAQFWANVISAEVITHYLFTLARASATPGTEATARYLAPPAGLIGRAMDEMGRRLATGQFPLILNAELTMARAFRGQIPRDLALQEMLSLLDSASATKTALDLDMAELKECIRLLEGTDAVAADCFVSQA